MSFFDHFTSLNSSVWGSITAGSGTVGVTDGYLECVKVASSDAAAVYLKTKIDKTKAQIYACSFAKHAGSNLWAMFLVDSATDPVAGSSALYDGNPSGISRVKIGVSSVGSVLGVTLSYHSPTHATVNYWNPATPAFQTTAVNAVITYYDDEFWDVFIETDPSLGFRMGVATISITGTTYAFDQGGPRIVALTDWVTWASIGSSDDLWLMLGNPVNNALTNTWRYEWFRYGDSPIAANSRQYAFTNCQDGNSTYNIRTSWTYDGQFFAPRDRGVTTDIASAKDPWVIYDGTTYHMFYRDETTTPRSIGRATSSSPAGPWTPQTAIYQSPANHTCSFPYVVYTPWEVSGREWQCLFADLNTSNTTGVARLLTASTPGGTWTDQGAVISPSATGTGDDDRVVASGPILHRNGQYEVWYSGNKDATEFPGYTGFRATGPSLSNLTKDGAGSRLAPQDAIEALTADLNGKTATMASTTGFVADMSVYVDNDATNLNWSTARVRKVNVNTSLELYSSLKGFTVAAGSKVFGSTAADQQIRDFVVQADGRMFVYMSYSDFAVQDSSIDGFLETDYLLIIPAGIDMTAMAMSMLSHIDGPLPYRGSWTNARSNENISFVHTALQRSAELNVLLGEPMIGGSVF